MAKAFDYLFKLLMIGDSGCGKTSILYRFTEKEFNSKFISILDTDFEIGVIDVEGKKVKLQVWDTERYFRAVNSFKTIAYSMFGGTSGLVFVYDITNVLSFEHIVIYWRYHAEERCEEDIPTVLVGHNSDMENKRVVSYQQGLEVAKKYNWAFFEISSTSCEDVNAMFTLLAKKCLVKIENDKPNTLPPVTLPLQIPQHEHQAGIFKRGFLKVKNTFFGPKAVSNDKNNIDTNNIDTIAKPLRQEQNIQSKINDLNNENEPEPCDQKRNSIEPCIKPKEHEQSDNMIEPESCQNLSSHPSLGECFSGETSGEMSDVMTRARVDSIQFPEPANPEYTHTRTVNTVENPQPDASKNEINAQLEMEPEQCRKIDVVEPESHVLLTDKRLPVEDIDETEYFDDNQFS